MIKLPTPPPLPTLPSPTVKLPTPRPLPTLPLPTLPLATLPPLPSNPTPSLPIPTFEVPGSSPAPELSGPAPAPDPAASTGPLGSGAAGGSGLEARSSPAVGAVGSVEETPPDQGSSPFQFAVPLIIVGIPIAVILLIVGLQVVSGAAFVPVIRRWLNRTPTTEA